MPTQGEHLAAAERNESFTAALLTGATFFDWAAVALFYAAVHYGRAYVIAKHGPTITSHRGFETHFLRLSGNVGLYGHYRRLKDESERARYDCKAYTKAEVEALDTDHFRPWRDGILASL